MTTHEPTPGPRPVPRGAGRLLSGDWAIYRTSDEIRCPAYLADRRHRPRAYEFERRMETRRCGYPDGRVGPGTVVWVRVYAGQDDCPGTCTIEACPECGATLQKVQTQAEAA